MGHHCCEDKSSEIAQLHQRQSRVLWAVLAVNAVLFVAEFTVGLISRSTALLGDSLDMLGDSLVYTLSLWVLHRGTLWRSRAALAKGFVQLGFGLFVLGQAGWKLLGSLDVDAGQMGVMAAIALAGNAFCFVLLTRHRSDDLNMRSTWLCSRNDLIANTAVIGAAFLVARTGNPWPDLIVGLAIAGLFLRTAFDVIADSRRELRSELESGSAHLQPSTVEVGPLQEVE